MGRLPTHFAGLEIKQRIPYHMYGETSLIASQTGFEMDSTPFTNTVAKPFEVHRFIPRVVAIGDASLPVDPQSDQSLLQSLVRANIQNVGLNEQITKVSTPLDSLVKGSTERTWEWADPSTLPTSYSFRVTLDTLAFPAAADYDTLKIGISFQGYLLVTAPPSEAR